MITDELRALLRGGEGYRVEFKLAAQRDEVKKTVVAFANRSNEPEPGVLFIGVRDDGTVIGVQKPDDIQKDLRRNIEDCYPLIEGWEVRPVALDDKVVIAVIIPESKTSPHFTGAAFVRKGSESVRASREMYEELLTNHVLSARRLHPWIGREIQVELERTDHRHGRIWSETRPLRRLISVDAIGIVFDEPGSAPSVADWSRVTLQPDVPGRPPYVRVSLD